MTKNYVYNKRWRENHPEKRYEGKKRNYNKTSFALNQHKRWSEEEIEAVTEHSMPDVELANMLGRSVQSIQILRCRVNGGVEKMEDK